jgi:predicted Zn-ribbon and HTH transcriptional regulator
MAQQGKALSHGQSLSIITAKSYETGFNNMQKLPKVCPKCKSPYWDKPKTNGKLK